MPEGLKQRNKNLTKKKSKCESFHCLQRLMCNVEYPIQKFSFSFSPFRIEENLNEQK